MCALAPPGSRCWTKGFPVRKATILANLLVVVGLSACGAAPPTPTAQPEPTAAAVIPSPTLIPTASPAPPTVSPTLALPTETPTPAPPTETPVPPTATPQPVEGTLALPKGALSTRPFAVMIDNHPDAYPQTGLDKAAVVFEALAEFGITRYMAIFAPGISPETEVLGPVRSARSYFVEWAKGFRAVYGHAGGSPEGLLLAETSIEIINMDALRGDTRDVFYRSSARAAPHNLYTDSTRMAAFADGKQNPAAAADLAEIGFLYKSAAEPSARPASQELSYFFIYPEQYVGWVYDPAQNDYLRFRAGRPYVDARTGEQLRFTNIVVMEVPEKPIPGDPKGRIEQQVIGQGPARLYVDGVEQEITWQKDAGFAQLRFYTLDGAEVQLNPGSLWIAAVPTLQNLTVKGGQ